MSAYAARESVRDALLFSCVLLLVWVGVQLTSVSSVLAQRYDNVRCAIETTLSTEDGSMKTVVRTPRQDGESDYSQRERHRLLLRQVKAFYPGVTIHADPDYDVDERR